MAHWQLDPTGRFPLALKQWLAQQDCDSEVTAYLLAWRWVIDNGFYYSAVPDDDRVTGEDGNVDCSGGVVLCTHAARDRMNAPAVSMPSASWTIARLCHDLPRPQWVTDLFGPGRGFGITAEQANASPGSLKFHGPREGQDGFSAGGHIASKYFIARFGDPHAGPGVSCEAMGRFAGVGYSQFIDNQDTYYALHPYLDGHVHAANQVKRAGEPVIFLCPNKPNTPHGKPHAQFIAAGSNQLFPRGVILLRWGASINNDQPTKTIGLRLMVPPAGHAWQGCCETRDRTGLIVVNEKGATSGDDSLDWS